MKATKIYWLIILSSLVSLRSQQDQEWKKELESMLYEFMSCGGPTAPNTPCNEFVAKSLMKVYQVKDFEKSADKYMVSNEIADYVSIHTDKWTLLGTGSSQKALDEAQGYANVKKAVIAIYKNSSGYGHIALILPGQTTSSSSWQLKTPNSASFFLDNPKGAYISKPLSSAFGANKKDNVLLYGRNY